MQKKIQILAGVYSFCLPGLGQVYAKRYVVGLLFTAIFCFFEWYAQQGLGMFIPLIALSSSIEAFMRSSKNNEQRFPVRDYLYASIAVAAFFFWIIAFAPYVIPL